jgi:serine/threonine protein kinase
MKEIRALTEWLGMGAFHQAPANLQVSDDPIAEGAFGKIYPLMLFGRQQLSIELLVKILPDSSALGFYTTQTLQRRCMIANGRRQSENRPPIEEVPGLIAIPRFSCRGTADGEPLIAIGMLRLDSYGYLSFDDILDRDDLLLEYQRTLPMSKRLELAFHLVEAFRLLRDQEFIHADINPKNIFINFETASLAIIDFDSGVVTDRAGQTPTTQGKQADGEWQGFEILRQSNQQKGDSPIKVNLLTDMWSVVVGIHNLLFLHGPLVFMSEISENSLREYFRSFRWPNCNQSFPYFRRDLNSLYQSYLKRLEDPVVAPLFKHFQHSINEGLLEPSRRIPYAQWKQHLQNCLSSTPKETAELRRSTIGNQRSFLATLNPLGTSRSTPVSVPLKLAATPPAPMRHGVAQPANIPTIRKPMPVSPPVAKRTGFKPSIVVGLGCLGVIAAWLIFVAISLLVQSQQASNRAANERANRTQADIAEQKNRQLSAIKVPGPDESVEFDITAYPNNWSPPITIPRNYHLAAEIIGNEGAKVWRGTDGNTNNYDVMTKAPGSVWNVWSNSFVKIYNPLGKRMPYMAGPWASSVQFESAERFPITIRIRLEPAQQNSTLDQKQRSALASTPPAQSSPSTRRHQGIFGIISSVDYNRQTFTVISVAGTNVFNVTNKTRILRAGTPVALSDVVENEKAKGVAVKNGDGSLDALILELGETEKAASGPNSGEIQTFNLQAMAYRDALQTMRQEWPHETFGYFDTKMSYGDITGDHKDEAAVWVHYRLSGEASTPSFSHVFVYTLKGGRVVLIATLKGGDRAYGGIESVKIQDDHLVLGRYKPETPDACMACYGFIETTDYRWDGNNLSTTAVHVSKLDRKSQNTSVEPDHGLLSKSASLAQTFPTIAPSSTPPVPLTFPGERFPDTRNRVLTTAELQTWSTDQLQYAINEIFARHGGDFPDKKVHANFERFAWYHPQPGLSFDQIEASLPYIEQQNVKTLGEARDTKRNRLSVAVGAWYGILYWKDGTANKQELIFTSDLSQVQNRASTVDASSGWNTYAVQKNGGTLNWQIPGPGRTTYLRLAPDPNGQQAQVSTQIIQQGKVAYSATGMFYRYDVPLPAPNLSGPDPRAQQIFSGLLNGISQAVQDASAPRNTRPMAPRSSNFRQKRP